MDRIATEVALEYPQLFARMGPNAGKRILIVPSGFPCVFLLVADPSKPKLSVHDSFDPPFHDAAIAGNVVALIELIEGSRDGDALFFNRGLNITGEVEAVVALRNALDDFDGDLVISLLEALGPITAPAVAAIPAIRAARRAFSHA
jgi:predicted lipid carrier protein YhbT